MRKAFEARTGCEPLNVTVPRPVSVCCTTPVLPSFYARRMTLFIPPNIPLVPPVCYCFTGIDKAAGKPGGGMAIAGAGIQLGLHQYGDDCCTKKFSMKLTFNVPCPGIHATLAATIGQVTPRMQINAAACGDCAYKLSFVFNMPCTPFQVRVTQKMNGFQDSDKGYVPAKYRFTGRAVPGSCKLEFGLSIKVPCTPILALVTKGQGPRYQQLNYVDNGDVVQNKLGAGAWSPLAAGCDGVYPRASAYAVTDTDGNVHNTHGMVYDNGAGQGGGGAYDWAVASTDDKRSIQQQTNQLQKAVPGPVNCSRVSMYNDTVKYRFTFHLTYTETPACIQWLSMKFQVPCAPFRVYYAHRDVVYNDNGIFGTPLPAGWHDVNVGPGDGNQVINLNDGPRQGAIFNTHIMYSGRPAIQHVNWKIPQFTLAFTRHGTISCAFTMKFDMAVPCMPLSLKLSRCPLAYNQLRPTLAFSAYMSPNCRLSFRFQLAMACQPTVHMKFTSTYDHKRPSPHISGSMQVDVGAQCSQVLNIKLKHGCFAESPTAFMLNWTYIAGRYTAIPPKNPTLMSHCTQKATFVLAFGGLKQCVTQWGRVYIDGDALYQTYCILCYTKGGLAGNFKDCARNKIADLKDCGS